ncbi:MAG: hypothetical protein V3S93_05685, partial [Methyloceanibacter sp.]
ASLFHKKRLQSARQQEGGLEMSLSPPTTIVFVISVVLAALAIIGAFIPIPVITDQGFWVMVVAFVILACGNIFRGF